jgi:hypothetical protein
MHMHALLGEVATVCHKSIHRISGRSGQRWAEVGRGGQRWAEVGRGGQRWAEVGKGGQSRQIRVKNVKRSETLSL